jgi:hypothetical protein
LIKIREFCELSLFAHSFKAFGNLGDFNQ